MPELTIRMAHYLIRELGLTGDDKVLDFGCAKGYLVRALRTLDIDAHGVDVSEYAINKADVGMAKYLTAIGSISDVAVYDGYSTVIAKDVLEHVPECEVLALMRGWRQAGSKLFVAVPVAIEGTERFVVPQYHNDVTHITIKSKSWWEEISRKAGYEIVYSRYSFPGVKENWVGKYPEGNVFLWLRARG